jgi:hypothetical protein
MNNYLITETASLGRPRRILGTIIAKSRPVALAKAIELTGIPRPIVVTYSSLTDRELELAKSAPILWTQPESKPKTKTNPRGAGPIPREGELLTISVKTRVNAEALEWYRSQPNKSRALAQCLEDAVEVRHLFSGNSCYFPVSLSVSIHLI